MPHALTLILVGSLLSLLGCKDDPLPIATGGGHDAAIDTTGARTDATGVVDAAEAAPDLAGACMPLASVDASLCPPTWSEAVAAQAAFCAKEGQRPSFSASLMPSCRGSLRYTRYLFDAGPRICLYDPSTLTLRGYGSFDGKAMRRTMTCGSEMADFDGKDCDELSCAHAFPRAATCGYAAELGKTGQCRGVRHLRQCQLTGGTTVSCPSDIATSCPSAATGATTSDPGCYDLCAANEYAVVCSGAATAPAGCKSMPPLPGGGGFRACCPCSADPPAADGKGALWLTSNGPESASPGFFETRMIVDVSGTLTGIADGPAESPRSTHSFLAGFGASQVLTILGSNGVTWSMGYHLEAGTPPVDLTPDLKALIGSVVQLRFRAIRSFGSAPAMILSDVVGVRFAMDLATWGDPLQPGDVPGLTVEEGPAVGITTTACFDRNNKSLKFTGDSAIEIAPAAQGSVNIQGKPFQAVNLFSFHMLGTPRCTDTSGGARGWTIWRTP